MNKADLASYLVSLHTLIEAQMKSPHAIPNTALADEYERCWSLLKEAIRKERENEARKSNDVRQRLEAGAGKQGGEPSRGGAVG